MGEVGPCGDEPTEERIELRAPEREGKCEFASFEESCMYGYRRGGPVRIVLARAVYKDELATEGESGEKPVVEFVAVPMPKELVERGLLAPPLVAHILVSKSRLPTTKAEPGASTPSTSRRSWPTLRYAPTRA